MANRIESPADVVMLAVVKGRQSYGIIFRPDPYGRARALYQCGRWARDKQLPGFTWREAFSLQQKIREACEA